MISYTLRATLWQIAGVLVIGLIWTLPSMGQLTPDVETLSKRLAAHFEALELDKALPVALQLLEIAEAIHGPESKEITIALGNVAAVYTTMGEFAKAEPYLKRRVFIAEKMFGPKDFNTAIAISDLAENYMEQGQPNTAEPLYRRNLDILAGLFEPDHMLIADAIEKLSLALRKQGKTAAAKALSEKAFASYNKKNPDQEKSGRENSKKSAVTMDIEAYFGNPNSVPRTWKSSFELGSWARFFLEEGEEFARDKALSFNARTRLSGDSFAKAERLFLHALDINLGLLGDRHPVVAHDYHELSKFYDLIGRPSDAVSTSRMAVTIYASRSSGGNGTYSAGRTEERIGAREIFEHHIALLLSRNGFNKDDPGTQKRIREAFEVSQLARASGTSRAVARMGARFAAGSDALANTARSRQNARERWLDLDRRLVSAMSRDHAMRDVSEEQAWRESLANVEAQLRDLDSELASKFPHYTDLINPRPVSVAETQKLLGPTEGAVAFLVGTNESYAWIVTRHAVTAYAIPDLGIEQASDLVADLRDGVDLSGIRDMENLPRFDTRIASDLYAQLLGPAAPYLESVRHLYFVPDRAFTSLPLGLLVTDKPTAPPFTISDYRKVAWFAKRHAISVLPSVSALRSLRVFAKRTKAKRPFIGFGDPVLGGEFDKGRPTVRMGDLMRSDGRLANLAEIRKLPPLPGTSDELYRIATAVGAAAQSVRLKSKANEATVRTENLTDYRVVAFATHGLVAGEISGLAEPALVLTPPKKATAGNDGLLTASEIAQLELNADLVLLSACNTAAAGTPDGEGLSGLAKAFIFAGTRSLLVSHWPVSSNATVKLVTTFFNEGVKEPALGKAESLYRARIAMMADDINPHFAHPAFWAPFVLVGEGGAYQPN